MLAADDLSVYFHRNCFFFYKAESSVWSHWVAFDEKWLPSLQILAVHVVYMCRTQFFFYINKLCFWKQMRCWNKNNGHKRKCEIVTFSLLEVEMHFLLKEFSINTLENDNQTIFTLPVVD